MSNIFRNTFRDIENIYKTLGEGHGVKFEHECYDTGHLYNLAHCVDRGLFKPPVFLQLIFGILGGIGPDLDNLMFMKRTADRLFGDDYLWSVLAGGRHQMNFCTQAAMMGGNVRVGLEDSLYIGKGKLAKSNAEQVTKIRRIIEDLGYEVATPKEAREMLGLKGADRVKFYFSFPPPRSGEIKIALPTPAASALIDQLAEGHVLERDAERLEQRQVGRRVAALGLAGHQVAELAHVRPGELAGRDQIAELAGFHLRLLHVIGRLHGGAQHRVVIDLAAVARIGAGRVDMRALGEPIGAEHRLGRFGDGDDDVRIAHAGFRRRHRAHLDAESFSISRA